MRGFRTLLLCLIAANVGARDAPRFAVDEVRAERTAAPSESGRFSIVATSRRTPPAASAAAQRFELAIAPGCDPSHVFANGFE